MVGSSSVSGPANSAAPVDPLVLELQKKLYKEQLIKQATVKRGSKYYPVNIEPFALERDRLALPFTEEDRALRKQWLSDQALSAREPVDIPEWTQVNVFRRAYRKPFDALARWIKPIVVRLFPHLHRFFRELSIAVIFDGLPRKFFGVWLYHGLCGIRSSTRPRSVRQFYFMTSVDLGVYKARYTN